MTATNRYKKMNIAFLVVVVPFPDLARRRNMLSTVLSGVENNQEAGKTYVYEYDSRGNILSRKTYDYTTTTLGAVIKTDTYEYLGGEYGDRLINYDSTYRIYDEIGNPIQYEKVVNGTFQAFEFDWQKGRQLSSATIGDAVYNYEYDSDGIRTSKTVGDTTYKYYTDGGQLKAMTISNGSTITTMQFYYNASGVPVAFKYDNTLYYYLTNIQGDVIGILDENGLCATYTYDAWGRIVDTFSMSNLSETLLSVNPLRYRGYIYDNETGFYYLQSRYYDPEVGRFINGDDVGYLGANGDFQSFNLFAYCSNNPVMGIDYSGNETTSFTVGFQFLFMGWGFSVSLSLVFSDENLGMQYTYYNSPFEVDNDENSMEHKDMWGFDVGIIACLQITEKDNIIELEGVTHSYGGDILMGLDILYDENHEYLGWQWSGGSTSINAHRMTTHTGTLFTIPTFNLPKKMKEAGWIK